MTSPPARHYAVVYQVFVDRYDPGGPVPEHPQRAADEGTIRTPFGAAPEQPPRGRDLQGGTLFGIANRLAHIRRLADALYLTPFMRAPSNHKYDAADFDVVDEHFGGEAGLAALRGAADGRGLALFFDAVLNHVGERHPWARDPAFVRGTGWRGHGSLPELALDRPQVRAAIVDVARRLVARGAAGLRLDCANDLGPSLCADIAQAVAQAGGAGGAIGELMSWPSAFLGDGGLDGVMNYWLRAALRSCTLGDAQIPVAKRALDRLAAEVGPARLLRSWTVLSSHDTPRLSDQVGFDEARARLWLAMQFAYPGTPLLYYGEEIGMSGGADPDCRRAMSWDEATWDEARLGFVQRLVTLRRRLPALTGGRYVVLDAPDGVLAFARATTRPEDTLVCVANPSRHRQEVALPLPLPGFYDALPLSDALAPRDHDARVDGGWLHLDLAPNDVRWLIPHDDAPNGYRFWKAGSL